MRPWPKYEIKRPGPGVLAYREGYKEHQFPIFEQDGETIFVVWPTRQRIFLLFFAGGWTRVPKKFSVVDRERITPRIVEHLRKSGKPVRVMAPSSAEEGGFEFHPELFECRSRASEILGDAGFALFSDFGSIDLLHEEYGLEICGISDESNIEPIAAAMRVGFPHWHYCGLCRKDYGREPGWRLAIHMFQRRCGGGRCQDSE